MGIKKHLMVQDLFTLLNAAFGVLSIFFAVQRNFFGAAIFMIIAVVFDYIDGKVGRMMKRSHEFGKELDSLADVISFGAAPAVFGYVYAGGSMGGASSTVLTVSLVIFVLCGALRLARFNVTKLKGAYEGMPITINGLIMPVIYFAMLPLKYYFALFLISAALMISSFRIKKII